ncbi:MAG TPA: FHA domain-containing protein [Roseiflexaceae bacterium]
MSKPMQVYYSAMLGALGGLLGWWSVGAVPTGAWNVWLAYPLVGVGLGLWIGGCVTATDAALIKRSAGRALRDGLRGAFAGALAGLVGLLLAELSFLGIGAGFAGRAIGWMLLGGFIGLAEPLLSRQVNRARYGAVGGMAGGLLGGALYEELTQLFLTQSDRAQVIVGGVGLILLGACIGALIPLARQAFSRGELRVLNGEQAGLVREVTDSASLGRYDGCDLYLPDPAVAWRHAMVRRTDQGFAMQVLSEAERGATVGARRLGPGETAPLRSGEQIWLGETAIEFVGR